MIDENIKLYLDSPKYENQVLGIILCKNNNISPNEIIDYYLHKSKVWVSKEMQYDCSFWDFYQASILGVLYEIHFEYEYAEEKTVIEGGGLYLDIDDKEYFGFKKDFYGYKDQHENYIHRVLEINISLSVFDALK